VVGDKGDVGSEADEVRDGTEVEAGEHNLVGRELVGIAHSPRSYHRGHPLKGPYISPRDAEDAVVSIFGGRNMPFENNV